MDPFQIEMIEDPLASDKLAYQPQWLTYSSLPQVATGVFTQYIQQMENQSLTDPEFDDLIWRLIRMSDEDESGDMIDFV